MPEPRDPSIELGPDGCPAGGLIVTVPNDGPEFDAQSSDENIAGRLIEFLSEVPGFSYQRALADDLEGASKAYQALRKSKLSYYRFQVPFGRTDELTQQALSALSEQPWTDGKVFAIEPDHDITLDALVGGTFTPGGQHNAYRDGFGRAVARAAGATGAGRRVVILDTGYAGPIPIAAAWDITSGQAVPVAAPYGDAHGHGTEMLTLAHSLAPDAEYAYVRLATHARRITIWGLLSALMIAKHDCAGDVISMSLGFDAMTACPHCGGTGAQKAFSLETQVAFVASYAGPSGRLPVLLASTGNGGHSDRIKYPSRFHEVVTIASIDSAGNHSRFSNYDRTGQAQRHHLCAYGGQTDPGNQPVEHVGLHGTSARYGTSHATAYSAGMMALLWSHLGIDDRDNFLDAVKQHHTLRLGQPMTHGHGLICFDPGTHPLAPRYSLTIGGRRISLP
ncbi:MAG: S8/S53 family peptidase [Pseudomonadota bacterium]